MNLFKPDINLKVIMLVFSSGWQIFQWIKPMFIETFQDPQIIVQQDSNLAHFKFCFKYVYREQVHFKLLQYFFVDLNESPDYEKISSIVTLK